MIVGLQQRPPVLGSQRPDRVGDRPGFQGTDRLIRDRQQPEDTVAHLMRPCLPGAERVQGPVAGDSERPRPGRAIGDRLRVQPCPRQCLLARCPPRAAGPGSSGATRTTAAGLSALGRARAPAPGEQDDAEAGGQGVRQARSAAAGKSHGERRGPVARVQQCHLSHAPLVPAPSAGLTGCRRRTRWRHAFAGAGPVLRAGKGLGRCRSQRTPGQP